MFNQPQYITFRNGHPYFTIRVPLDLLPQVNRKFIRKSLKTTNKQEALIMAGGLQQKYLSSFSLLRSGALTPEQTDCLLDDLATRKAQKKNLRLSDLYQLYHAERSPDWSSKSVGEIPKQFDRIISASGDLHLTSLKRASLIVGREKLLEVLSVGTVNRLMTLLSSVLKWGIKHEYTTRNPAEGLQLDQKRRADEERKAYDKEDLKRIIEHLPHEEGKPERYFIPLIAMYSGLRLDEACQLYTEDIKEISGIWCIDVNNEKDKKLKTASSKRLIPIHQKLIEAGLLEYAQSITTDRLWMNLKYRAVDGYSSCFGTWWSSKFNRKYITEDNRKCFHSFRHTFVNTLKQADVNEVKIAELVGHANSSMTSGRYGKRYEVEKLKETIDRLVYEGVDFSMFRLSPVGTDNE